jgi:protein involved in polysaccharide export with SLBB domain
VKNKILFCFVFILGIYLGFPLSAQEEEVVTTQQASNVDADLTAATADANRNIMLARSSTDYMVTPGDVYTLAYAAGSTPVSYIITVDTSYRIRISNLGITNGAGKTFPQLRREVENVVANNYPLSGVQLVLTQPAIFRVYLQGEVRTAGEVSAWGLSRLSSFAGRNLTSYASIRDISVTSSNGQTRVYDLFKAQRSGDLSQNPHLRPGDTVTFNRIDRVVTVNGAVERPGRYQILKGENLKSLIEVYANGFTPLADPTRMELVRLINSEDVSGDRIFLTEDDLVNDYALEHFDAVTVPSIIQLRSVMFVEGAVASTRQALDDLDQSTSSEAQDLTTSTRLVVQFVSGETYASLVRRNIRWFTAVSDTQNSYILRNDERIPIDINIMLYDVTYRDSVLVQENDVLIIPFRQYFVTVSGAIVNPGRYPYIPDRDWEYYIALAGGFIMGRNARETITITDISGKRMRKTDAITPETIITAETNHALYYFNQYAPIITTILSVVTTFISIMMLSAR